MYLNERCWKILGHSCTHVSRWYNFVHPQKPRLHFFIQNQPSSQPWTTALLFAPYLAKGLGHAGPALWRLGKKILPIQIGASTFPGKRLRIRIEAHQIYKWCFTKPINKWMVLNYPVLGVCKSGIFSRETVDVRPRSHPNPLSFPSPAVDGAQPPHQASVAEPCPARSPPWPGRSWQGRTPGMEQETAGVSNPELEGVPGVARLGIVEISSQNARTCKRLQKHILLLAAASQRYAA